MKRQIIRLTEADLHNIIKNTVKSLIKESEEESSEPSNVVAQKLQEFDFKILSKTSSEIEAYFRVSNERSDQEEELIIHQAISMIKQCGWICKLCGGYYDDNRLRWKLEDIEKKDSEANRYGTYYFCFEANYGDIIDKEGFRKWHEHDDTDLEDYERDERCGIKYEDNIFWHITQRQFVPSIMENGLVPKRGHSLTRNRNFKERVYLSTVPEDLEEIANYNNPDFYGDEPREKDKILLKVDITPIEGQIKFYVDPDYNNAVYTYSTIPPECITVVEGSDMANDYFIRKEINERIDNILEALKYRYSKECLLACVGWMTNYIITHTRYGWIPRMYERDDMRQKIIDMIMEEIKKRQQ